MSFVPTSRSRARIAGGVGLLALAVVVNLAVYLSLDDRRAVLQVVRDVPAGQQLVAADLRTVKVGADPTVRTLPAASLDVTIGQFAKVRLVAGSLVVAEALQASPLVGPGSSLVAVTVAAGELPIGVRERSRVELVLPVASSLDPTGPASGEGAPAGRVVEARAVGLPTPIDSSGGGLTVTFEVARDDAATVATAERVRVVLLDPGSDPASPGVGPR